MKLISTAFRQKLSNELSPPLGAQFSGDAWSDAPRYPKLFIGVRTKWDAKRVKSQIAALNKSASAEGVANPNFPTDQQPAKHSGHWFRC